MRKLPAAPWRRGWTAPSGCLWCSETMPRRHRGRADDRDRSREWSGAVPRERRSSGAEKAWDPPHRGPWGQRPVLSRRPHVCPMLDGRAAEVARRGRYRYRRVVEGAAATTIGTALYALEPLASCRIVPAPAELGPPEMDDRRTLRDSAVSKRVSRRPPGCS